MAMTASPMTSLDPTGRASRSIPRVVMLSPQVSGGNRENSQAQVVEQFAVNEVHLAEFRLRGVRSYPRPVLYRRPTMGIALDT